MATNNAQEITDAVKERYGSTLLADAGFEQIDLEVTRRYSIDQLGATLPEWAQELGVEQASEIVSRFASTFVRATKPAA